MGLFGVSGYEAGEQYHKRLTFVKKIGNTSKCGMIFKDEQGNELIWVSNVASQIREIEQVDGSEVYTFFVSPNVQQRVWRHEPLRISIKRLRFDKEREEHEFFIGSPQWKNKQKALISSEIVCTLEENEVDMNRSLLESALRGMSAIELNELRSVIKQLSKK